MECKDLTWGLPQFRRPSRAGMLACAVMGVASNWLSGWLCALNPVDSLAMRTKDISQTSVWPWWTPMSWPAISQFMTPELCEQRRLQETSTRTPREMRYLAASRPPPPGSFAYRMSNLPDTFADRIANLTTTRARYLCSTRQLDNMWWVEERSAGLPFRGIVEGTAQWFSNRNEMPGGRELPVWEWRGLGRTWRLALMPQFPGAILNTVCFGTLAWLAWAGVAAIRARRRVGRNQCPRCAYQLGGILPVHTVVCPECGLAASVS